MGRVRDELKRRLLVGGGIAAIFDRSGVSKRIAAAAGRSRENSWRRMSAWDKEIIRPIQAS